MSQLSNMTSTGAWTVQFERLFVVPQLYQDFSNYAKKARMTEMLDFLEDYNSCEKISNETKLDATVRSIVEKYIKVNSEKELNFDAHTRDAITEVLKLGKNVTLALLRPVYKIVYRELKEDVFARYIRSTDFQTLCDKLGESFMPEIAINETIAGTLMYQPSDFRSTTITDRDIQFVLKITQDSSDWECIKHSSSNKYRVYLSKTNYAIGGASKLKLFKVVMFLDCSAEEALHTTLDMELDAKRDPQTVSFKDIDYIKNNSDPYSVAVIRRVLKLGPVLDPRYATLLSTVVKDTEKECYILVGVSSTEFDSDIDPKSKLVRSDLIIGASFNRISEKRCRLVFANYVDFKIPFDSNTLFTKVMEKRGKDLYKGTVAAVAMKREKDGFKLDMNGRANTLSDFKEKYLPNSDSIKTWSV
jgi:hypothetical protein